MGSQGVYSPSIKTLGSRASRPGQDDSSRDQSTPVVDLGLAGTFLSTPMYLGERRYREQPVTLVGQHQGDSQLGR